MTTPELSIVIAAHDAAAVIAPCLRALAIQSGQHLVEVIVADSSDDGTDRIVSDGFPSVRLLHFEAPLTVPELRGKGIAIARGGIVAILDPYSIVAEDWAACLISVHAKVSNVVIGGSVDKHPDSPPGLLGWALYFNEYGMFMNPVARGPVGIVPGSNVSYKRSHLFDGERARHGVFWKTFVNAEAGRPGQALWLAPEVRVLLLKPIPFADFLRTRFFHGRCYAAMRVEGQALPARWLRAASTPLVPVVLLWRWSRAIWPKRRHRRAYIQTLPLQLALFGVWAFGEFVGYLLGAGTSCRRLFY